MEDKKQNEGIGQPADQVDAITQVEAAIEDSPKKDGKKTRSRRFRHGAVSTLFVIGVIVIAILLNIGATALQDRFPSLRLDMTANGSLSVSEELGKVIDSVEHETRVMFLSSKENFMNNLGTEGLRLTELAAKAAERNDKISVQYIDMEADPAFAQKYKETLDPISLIVETDKRYKVVTAQNMISTDSSTGQYVSIIETALASALLAVNSDRLPVIGFTTGSGEQDSTTLQNFLRNNNFEPQSINLLTSNEISSDIDVLVINAPRYDLTEQQVSVLDKFLQNGEKYGKSVYVALSPSMEEAPNLKAFLADWGIGMPDVGDYVIESNQNRFMQNPVYPYLQVPEDSQLKDVTKTVGAYALVPMEQLWESRNSTFTEVLLASYDTSYRVDTSKVSEDENWEPSQEDYGPFPALIDSYLTASVGGEYAYSHVYAGASADLFGTFLNGSSYGNADCALKLFQKMTNTAGTGVSIKPTALIDINMTVSVRQADVVGLILLAICLPIAVAACGFIVWFRRRHL